MDNIYYLDITKDGKDLTGKKDIGLIANNQAVIESVKNILMTEPGQYIMDPEFGTPLYHFRFEPIDDLTSTRIEMSIIESLGKYESRIDNIEVSVQADPDQNTYIIEVFFTIHYSNDVQSIKLTLDKVR